MDALFATICALGFAVAAACAAYDVITRTPGYPGLWWRRELVWLVGMVTGAAGFYALVFANTGEEFRYARGIMFVGIFVLWWLWWKLIKYRQANNIRGPFGKIRM